MKDHERRQLVDELTAVAKSHEGCQSLREAIAHVVNKHVALTTVIKNRHVPLRHEVFGDERPAMFPAKPYPTDSQGRCIECQGWGCHVCCGSDAEIRARQGIFG